MRARLIGAFTLLVWLAGCGSSTPADDNNTPNPNPNPNPPPQNTITLAGSIGDGPVINADITVTDANGDVVASGSGSLTARYEIDVPEGTAYPIVVRARGGTDLVSGAAPDLDLYAIVADPALRTANVTVMSTLAYRTADCSVGAVDSASLSAAWGHIADHTPMGWEPGAIPDPVGVEVGLGNIAEIVLVNEALGEALRRTAAAVQAAGGSSNVDDVARLVGCDLASGAIDGQGSGIDARVSATFHAATASVLAELATGQLRVGGNNAVALMNDAIATVFPGANVPEVTDVPRDKLRELARDAIAALTRVVGNSGLVDILLEIELDPEAGLDGPELDLLANGAEQVAMADADSHNEILSAVSETETAFEPLLSFAAEPNAVLEGQSTTLTWSSANADHCVADGDWSGEQLLSGNANTGALETTATFTLTCVGIGGNASETVVVSTNGIPPVELTFGAEETMVPAMGTTTLTWDTENATECVASDGWAGTLGTAGSQEVGPLDTDTTFELTCSGGGPSAVASIDVTIVPPPTVALSSNADTIGSNGSVTLSWISSGADACVAGGGWTGDLTPSGSATIDNIGDDATFDIACTGFGGAANDSVAVTVAAMPGVALNADSTSIPLNGDVTLTWSASNADGCTASGGWSGDLDASGSQTIADLDQATTFDLACTGLSGTSNASVAVDIIPTPTVILTAAATDIAMNGAAELTWSSTDADSCAAEGGWSGDLESGGTQTISDLTADTTFNLSCSGPSGSDTASVMVHVVPLPTATLDVDATNVAINTDVELSWSSTDTDGCVASGNWNGNLNAAGTRTVTVTQPSTFDLACAGLSGTDTASVSVSIIPAPVITFTVDEALIPLDGDVVLTWSATGADSCTATGDWSGDRDPAGGSETVQGLGAESSFGLDCEGAGGPTTETIVVSIIPAPAVTLTPDNGIIATDGSVTLTWSATDADTCTASGGWTGTDLAASGSSTEGPLTADTTFDLACDGPSGSGSASVTVAVTDLPVITAFDVDVTTVALNDGVNLTWNSVADGCTASGHPQFSGSVATSSTGTAITGLTTDTTFTLACSNAVGTSPDSQVSVTVIPEPTANLNASSGSVDSGGTVNLTWDSADADTCTASGGSGWAGSVALNGGPLATSALTADTTFTLTCDNISGTAMVSVSVVMRIADLSWEAPTENVDGTPIVGIQKYTIYYGDTSRVYDLTLDVTDPATLMAQIPLSPGTTFFAITVTDTDDIESDYSNEVSKTIPQ